MERTADALRASYDELPYPSVAIRPSHPGRLAAAARILGLAPTPIERCRVLELGCAGGGNLVPMAAGLPGASFVGVDLSPRQIDEARALAAAIGVGNVTWLAADLTTLGDLGEFDFIVCHGVYSWVPPAVQGHILALCRRLLAPQGVAYVSYNTYPGFHARQPVRDLMRYHTRGLAPAKAAPEARRALNVLLASFGDPSLPYARALRGEADKLATLPDGYLSHEYLEADNHPCYFHEFMAAAAAHGLELLCEAERLGTFHDLPEGFQSLVGSDDVIEREQYFDFLFNRSLRRTLLCRPGPRAESDLAGLWALGAAIPLDDPEAPSVRFRVGGGEVSVSDGVVKDLLGLLHRRAPRAVAVAELSGAALAALPHVWAAGVCDVTSHAPEVAATVSARPVAAPLARLLATRQTAVPNLWHQLVELDPLERGILPMLDGSYHHGPRAGFSPPFDEALARLAVNALLTA